MKFFNRLKFIYFCTVFAFVFSLFLSFGAPSYASTTPTVNSEAAILMDAKQGKVLYEKNSTKQMYPASTTKVMTAILTVENCDLNAEVTVSYWAVNAVPYSYSLGYITPGEVYTVEELLNVTMIASANDAAYVLAEYIANLDNPDYVFETTQTSRDAFDNSIAEFSTMMNDKAKEIGCTNTNFVNPNGIYNDNHYSTAYDLALIGKYAYENAIIKSIGSKASYDLPKNENHPTYTSTNALLRNTHRYYYEYANGLKTGYTDAAGYCIIATASKDGIDLICVILKGSYLADGTATRETDCINLFNYGFDNYKSVNLVSEGDVVRTIDVLNGTEDTKKLDVTAVTTLNCVVFTDEVVDVTPVIQFNSVLAPIAEGQVVGSITYTVDGVDYKSDLIATHDVYSSNVMNIILALFAVFAVLLVIVTALSIKKKD